MARGTPEQMGRAMGKGVFLALVTLSWAVWLGALVRIFRWVSGL